MRNDVSTNRSAHFGAITKSEFHCISWIAENLLQLSWAKLPRSMTENLRTELFTLDCSLHVNHQEIKLMPLSASLQCMVLFFQWLFHLFCLDKTCNHDQTWLNGMHSKDQKKIKTNIKHIAWFSSSEKLFSLRSRETQSAMIPEFG